MRLTKASAYAVIATVHIARHEKNGPVQGRSIADAYGIPVEYLLKILQQLVRAQILRSETGRRGGFALKRTPTRTTLLDIVEAIDGPVEGGLSIGREISNVNGVRSELEGVCKRIAQSTRTALKEISLKNMLR